VFCGSLHADPTTYYPWYAGHADERGEGAGLGCNLNLPLAHGAGDDDVLAAAESALAAINRFAPDALLVALGLDAAADDPLGVLKVSRAGFQAMGARIGGFAGPVVLVQEGGYMSPGLGGNLAAFLTGFAGAHAR
jgi:acetoin utilization deacetylase AcuC-like enzyme